MRNQSRRIIALTTALSLCALLPLSVTRALASPPGECSLHTVRYCNSVIQLQDELTAPLHAFLGDRRTNFSSSGRKPIVDDLSPFFTHPGDSVSRIGENYRFTLCIMHACEEKLALVLTPRGRIVAVGVLADDFHTEKIKADGADYYSLWLYVRRHDPDRASAVANPVGVGAESHRILRRDGAAAFISLYRIC